MEIRPILSKRREEIVWEKEVITIPFDNDNERDKQLFNLMQKLQDRIEQLEQEKGILEHLRVDTNEAKNKVISFLKDIKLRGHSKIDVFEISHKLKLPAIQVEEI